MKRFLIFLFFISFVSFGQTKEEIELCAAIQANSFTTDKEAERALNRILSIIGASSKNFVLAPCDKIDNAIATSYKGTRYIFYDKDFMKLINQNTNDWSNILILAHEVGHHIRGHSIDILLYSNDVVDEPTLQKSREMELEADEFAGFVLAKLGATLTEATEAIALITSDEDDTYSTHPSKSKRLEAIRKGYNNSKYDVASNQTISSSINNENYYYSAMKKDENGDYYGVIEDLSRFVELNAHSSAKIVISAYYKMAMTKAILGENNCLVFGNKSCLNEFFIYEAIDDYTKVIELDPNNSGAYNNRNNLYRSLATDFNNSKPFDTVKYINLINKAIDDINKMVELRLNSENYDSYYYDIGFALFVCSQYERAIEYYTKAIELNPDNERSLHVFQSYYMRGLAKSAIGDYKGAIEDYTKAIELNADDYSYYDNRAFAKSIIGDDEGAIEDYTKAIELCPDCSFIYSSRVFFAQDRVFDFYDVKKERKKEERIYTDSKLTKITRYYESGVVKMEINYKFPTGELISQECWDEDGTEKECE